MSTAWNSIRDSTLRLGEGAGGGRDGLGWRDALLGLLETLRAIGLAGGSSTVDQSDPSQVRTTGSLRVLIS